MGIYKGWSNNMLQFLSDSPEVSFVGMRRRPLIVPLSILALTISVLSGCHRPEITATKPKPPEVFVATPVEDTVIEFEEVTGRTMAVNTVELRSRVSGYLDAVFFKDGDEVQQGDVLFQIDPRPYQTELNRTEAAVAQAKSHLERLKRQLERANRLLRTKTMSQEDHDLIAFERDESTALLAAAEANKAAAELNMSFTKIKAPVSGRISRRLVDPGNLVQADMTPLTTIVSLDPMYAYFDVDERTLLRLQRLIQEGKISTLDSQVVAEIALADEDDYAHRGTINFLDNQVEASTGTLRARALIDNSNRMLSPGLFVRLRIPIGAPRKAIVVQEEALASDQGQRFVYVVNDKDEVNYRRVKVGWQLASGMRVIEEGLELGDRVVVTGVQRVKPGLKVDPKPFAKDSATATKVAAAATPAERPENQSANGQAK